eukprot:10293863-Ditylum_brightwellii.AAC.1
MARKDLKKAKKQATEIHNGYLKEMATMEEQQRGAVSYATAPVELERNAMYDEVVSGLGFEPEWTCIDDNELVMSKLPLKNKLYLHQAWETPCNCGQIKDYIGQYGVKAGSEDILDGSFDLN